MWIKFCIFCFCRVLQEGMNSVEDDEAFANFGRKVMVYVSVLQTM